MPTDYSVALQTKTPNINEALTPISSMLNIAQGTQTLRQSQIETSQKQMQWDARLGVAKVLSDPQYRDDQGQVDFTKATPALTDADPSGFYGPQVLSAMAQARSHVVNAQSAQQQLNANQWGTVAAGIGGDIPRLSQNIDPKGNLKDPNLDPLSTMTERIMDLQKTGQITPQFAGMVISRAPVNGTYAQKLAWIKSVQMSSLAAANQVAQQNQPVTLVNTGPTINPVQTAPLSGGGIGPVPGAIPVGYSPTQPTVTPQGQPTTTGGPGARPIPLAPPLGQPENVAGTVAAVNADWQQTVQEGQKAAQDIGVLQNIKKYATGAVTGIASDRRSWLSGLAGLLGMNSEQLAKTDTDLLAKNEKMLALAGGNTNLAKTLAESANPNIHMTPQAIKSAADQVIAQREMPLEKQHYFSRLRGDFNAYNQALAEWNQHADPRVLQYPNMNKKEKQDMRNAMSPQEAVTFANHLKWFQEKGILK